MNPTGGPPGMKRRAPRLTTHLRGSLRGRASRPITVLDLSQSGCLVQCDALLDAGAIFDVELELPGGTLRAKVQVTGSYVDGTTVSGESPGYQAGLQFMGLSAQDEARLRVFLEEEKRRRQGADSPSR